MQEIPSIIPPEGLESALELALLEGEMTTVTPEIRDISKEIGGATDMEYIAGVALYLHEHYVLPPKRKHKPDKMKRTAHEILVSDPVSPVVATTLPPGKRPIGTCTEHGKAIRALLLARSIPCVWMQTVSNGWIKAEGEDMDPDSYNDHVFLLVFADGKWRVLNSTARPTSSDTWIYDYYKGVEFALSCIVEDGNGIKSKKTERYHLVAYGLEDTYLLDLDGNRLSFRTKVDWHRWVNHHFPERMRNLPRLPKDY